MRPQQHTTHERHQWRRAPMSLATTTTSRCVNTPLPPLSLLTGKPGATLLTATWQRNTKTSHSRPPPPPPRDNCPRTKTTAHVQKQQPAYGNDVPTDDNDHHSLPLPHSPSVLHHTTPSPLPHALSVLHHTTPSPLLHSLSVLHHTTTPSLTPLP